MLGRTGIHTQEEDIVEDVGEDSGREAPGLKVVEEESGQVKEEAGCWHEDRTEDSGHQAQAWQVYIYITD